MPRHLLALVGLVLLLSACGPGGRAVPQAEVSAGYARPELLAETDWLAANLQDPGIRVVDLRSWEAYQAGHIPGAVWLDGRKLDDPQTQYIPGPEDFARLMGGLGIGNETLVVGYDDQGGLWAARLWWALDYYGHGRAKVLNGGWNKWVKEGRPVSREAPEVRPAVFAPRVNEGVICRLDHLKAALGKPGVVLLDARSPAEYGGMDVRARRGGHIPGAVNIDWQLTVTQDDLKVFKPAAELRRLFEAAGVTPDKEVITYCQTGVRAAHALFVLRLLGYDRVRNYDGSSAEWGNNPELPIER
jgi:thiosulfate/3-mercaptopyruvate sulfurtransferase